MLRKFSGWVLVGALVLVAGCGGEPRLDATSNATVGSSLKAMGDRLDDAKKKKLAGAITVLTLPAPMKASFADMHKAPKLSRDDIFKPLHGMTADEIIAKADISVAAFKSGLAKK